MVPSPSRVANSGAPANIPMVAHEASHVSRAGWMA
jgi:hypothetical protein